MNKLSTAIVGLLGAAGFGVSGAARAATPYPVMAPLGGYLMPDRAAEIALARSAAPPSVSAGAEILVLGPKGYATAVAGRNGFTCLVERSWFAGLKDDGFWNPKLRGPDCYNRQAARSVLPTFLMRTRWALAGASRGEIIKRTQAAMAAGRIRAPERGSMNYMLSKHGYLGDSVHGPWHPHLMFYMPPMQASDWGADLPGTHVFAARADTGIDPYTLFFVPVGIWSDGSPDDQAGTRHTM
ncbi:MAG TPA: hypothetical protein VFW19_15740 [Allosphingosinicella sp.]|nr:hypothetical protein [Allosphingosinicella sp.]